ncbi:MAG: alpha-galactosidase [Lewinellaceae bacterium]|nr:alpha-galactosidase [Lewinellaceae bacterium]
MHFRQAIFRVNDKTYHPAPGRANSFDEIYIDFQHQDENGGERYSVFLHPKADVTIQRLEIQFDISLSEDAKFFANGFQSWSESRLLPVTGRIPRLRGIARRRLGFYGDEHIPGIPRGDGYLHSWTYTYVSRNAVPEAGHSERRSGVQFWGSLNESTGFTLFLYDRPNGILTVRKDLDGLQLSHSFPALDFWVGEGSEAELFDRYFQILGITPPAAPPAMGWTSWYRYFNRITEDILLQNLDAFAATQPPAPAFFQIDDGWQTAVGDWLSATPAFPRGMGALAKNIREKGLLPGLWLAPFVAAKNSELTRKHPEWLLKDAKGKPLKAGWNPMWGGWYHALDVYNNEVRNYLGGVFHLITGQWGYELVKLDFLFVAALAPPRGKTRGQVMHEAMDFLQKLAGAKKILACGVPLGSTFGLADYCRIGGDIHLSWEHRLLVFLRFRERVSTLAALRSTLGRWQLNGRAFHNDPDVFILRSDHQRLTPVQQQTVLTLNALLGNLLFTSDDTSRYSPEQKAEFDGAMALRGSRVLSVFELQTDVYRIDFEQLGEGFSAFFNLNETKRMLHLPAGPVELDAYEHLILNIR